MFFAFIYPLCCIILAQNSFGRTLRETRIGDGETEAGDGFAINNRRGVTYIKPPQNPPFISEEPVNLSQERRNRENLKYAIFERADERPGPRSPTSPVTSKPTTGTLPPQKTGPVLFPDEEAAATTQSNKTNANQKDGKSNPSNRKESTSSNLSNSSQDQRINPSDRNSNSNDNNKQRKGNENNGRKESKSNGREGRPRGDRNRNNGSNNNGQGQPANRRTCLFFFC